jgi:hypothetical protein
VYTLNRYWRSRGLALSRIPHTRCSRFSCFSVHPYDCEAGSAVLPHAPGRPQFLRGFCLTVAYCGRAMSTVHHHAAAGKTVAAVAFPEA